MKSEIIRQELRQLRFKKQHIENEIVGLEIQLLISLREEDKIGRDMNYDYQTLGGVKCVPKEHRVKKTKSTSVDVNELKRLLKEVE